MGNTTNDRNWAAMERLRFIETCAWWRGTVQRQDLAGLFGVSLAQASADLQRYLELNPLALSYNLRKKRYEATPAMECVLGEPDFDEAVARFLGGGARPSGPLVAGPGGEARVALLEMPVRRATAQVERRVFLAVVNGLRIRVRYASVHGGREEWRWLRPHALGHNGARWHLRAWCEACSGFRDFTLSRIAEVDWSVEPAELPKRDGDWERMVTLWLRPSSKLTPMQVRAVERDFGMVRGVLRLRVRKAMEGYLRDRLGLPVAGGATPAGLLEEVDAADGPRNPEPTSRF